MYVRQYGVICALAALLVALHQAHTASASGAPIPDREKMANAFEVNGVVPDVIDVAPASTAEVTDTQSGPFCVQHASNHTNVNELGLHIHCGSMCLSL